MYYFEYSFTISQGDNLHTSSQKRDKDYKGVVDCCKNIAKTYDLSFDHNECDCFDHQYQRELNGITVKFHREVKQQRSAYSLLKICEASVDLLVVSGAGDFQNATWRIDKID